MSKHVLIRHIVSDYPSWKIAFDSNQGERQSHGLKDLHILRDNTNQNHVTILLEAQDIEKAKAFASSQQLRETMQKAGVVGNPEISYLSDATKSY